MAVRYTMREPGGDHDLPDKPFGLYSEGVAIHEILRLLTGSINLFDKQHDSLIELDENELRADFTRASDPELIRAALFSDEINLDEYRHFVISASAENKVFFTQLQNELVLCLISKKRGNSTEAFLYLYRILEFISLAFPMLYASTQRNFKRSHDFLKSLLENERDGDLKILSRALPFIASQNELNLVKFDFSISGLEIPLVKEIKKQLESKVRPQVKDMEFEQEGDILFRVGYNNIPSLFVSVRNRMFHYKIGEPNIDLGDIGAADRICDMCVPELIRWFALTFAEVVRLLARQQI